MEVAFPLLPAAADVRALTEALETHWGEAPTAYERPVPTFAPRSQSELPGEPEASPRPTT